MILPPISEISHHHKVTNITVTNYFRPDPLLHEHYPDQENLIFFVNTRDNFD